MNVAGSKRGPVWVFYILILTVEANISVLPDVVDFRWVISVNLLTAVVPSSGQFSESDLCADFRKTKCRPAPVWTACSLIWMLWACTDPPQAGNRSHMEHAQGKNRFCKANWLHTLTLGQIRGGGLCELRFKFYWSVYVTHSCNMTLKLAKGSKGLQETLDLRFRSQQLSWHKSSIDLLELTQPTYGMFIVWHFLFFYWNSSSLSPKKMVQKEP